VTALVCPQCGCPVALTIVEDTGDTEATRRRDAWADAVTNAALAEARAAAATADALAKGAPTEADR
jgi:uncharacterized protein GlcG (DUF336 family)